MSSGCPWFARLAALLVLCFLVGGMASSFCDLACGQSLEITCQSCSQEQEPCCDCALDDGTLALIEPLSALGPVVSHRTDILTVDENVRDGVNPSIDHPPHVIEA
jgi:hypothetical protein